jgi:aflatoxin B1 aldehyde reductase
MESANRMQGHLHRGRYWDDLCLDELDIIRPVAKNYGLTETECVLSHHSQLEREKGDAIIVGVSCTKHLEESLATRNQGSLLEEVVQALDDGWQRVRGKELKFWH